MIPIDRARRERQLAEDQRLALSAPPLPRMTREEMVAKFGPGFGITSEPRRKNAWEPRKLADICAEMGVDLAEVERADAEAKRHRKATGQP